MGKNQKELEKNQVTNEKISEKMNEKAEANGNEERQISTSGIIDSIMEDSNKGALIAAAFMLIIGAFLNFWGLSGDFGKVSQDSLIEGFMFGGLFGKLCVICGVLSAVAVCFNVLKYGWYLSIVSIGAFVIQSVIIFVKGNTVVVGGSVHLGFGFYISLAAIILEIIAIWKIKKSRKDGETIEVRKDE